MTKVSVRSSSDKNIPLAAVVFQEDKTPVWSRRAAALPREILRAAREDGFRAGLGSSHLFRPAGGRPLERVLLLSAGKAAEAKWQDLRRAGAAAARWALQARAGSLAFLPPGQLGSMEEEVQALTEGFLLGAYRFTRHQGNPKSAAPPSDVRFIVKEKEKESAARGARRGEIFAGAANFARDLINEPPSLKVPETLAKAAVKLAGSGIRVRVYRKGDLKRMGMNALLGVNRGSAHPPVLVHLHYKPSGRPRRRLAFVGKGITFDSGGLSLKTADGMMTMKYDMAGAAVVFSLFHALARLRPPVEVHGLAPITENMPGHDAYKPGDVLRASNGKTIEVLNTDAEGRVVLSDALSFAAKLNVDEILDAATLTGAVSVALGRAYAALMSNDDGVAARLLRASEKSGEKVWRLPLEPSYKDHIRSKVADLKNIGNPGEAGTIIGGLFLQEFVGGKPWAHLDIAGCGWNADGSLWGAPGATGVMARTFLQYVMDS